MGIAAGIAIGNVAVGASALSVAAKAYTFGSAAIGMVNSGINVANTGSVGIGDALAFAPAIGFGIGKLTGKVLGGACFFAGTLVATESGQKPIEQVTAGERVWSCDLVSGDWKLCKVAETYVFDHIGEMIEVFVAGRKIESTYHHPYWVIEGEDLDERPKPDHVVEAEVPGATVSGRWVDAGDLHVGDKLLLLDGRHATIEEILVRQVEEPVYNFAVDRLHNYAVGPDRVLVHNNCAAGDASVVAASELLPTHRIKAKFGQLDELKADIKANGIQEPLKYVELNGKKYVVDGHHRLRVARELGIKSVPAMRVELPYGGYKVVDDLFNYFTF